MTFVLTSADGPLTDDGDIINFDTRSQAEAKKTELKGLFDNLTIEQRGVEEVDPEVIDMSTDGGNSDNDDELPGVDICSRCGNEINDGHCPDCDGCGDRIDEAVVERIRGVNLVLREAVNLMNSHRREITFDDVDRKEEFNEIVDQLQDAESRNTTLLAEVVEDARRQKRTGDD